MNRKRGYAAFLGVAVTVADWGMAKQACAANPVNDPNATQSTMNPVIVDACVRGATGVVDNSPEFQARCNSVVGAAFNKTDANSQNQAGYAVNQVTPNQFVAFDTQATRLTGGQLNQLQTAIGSRLDTLYASLANQTAPMFASLAGSTGGAAGDAETFQGPFGVWFTNAYNTGSVSSSFNQLGYGFGNWGLTIGADYKAMEQLAVGAAFTYQMYSADFASSMGNSETDMYTGTIYAAYTPTDNWHIDAAASYGGNDYSATRNINYAISAAGSVPADTVHTAATSNPGGYHYSFNVRSGYNIVVDALTIEPFARFNYYTLTVDPYNEKGGDGWGLRVGQQDVTSLITTLGSQFSYALSFPWGVLFPQFHAEWHHQYKNNSQAFRASFLGDPTAQEFGIVTIGPTRNFATLGARLAASVGHGVSAVLGYDTLLGYQDITAHRVMLSARMDF